MAFAMKEVGVSCAIMFIFSKCLFLESFLDCLHIVWALHYIHIAVEVTMNMAILVVVVNLEPIIIGLKNDNVDWDQV